MQLLQAKKKGWAKFSATCTEKLAILNTLAF
jgi:hypothetical protein